VAVYKQFIDSVFSDLEQRGNKNLIIDLITDDKIVVDYFAAAGK
jgi:hypothetical protein